MNMTTERHKHTKQKKQKKKRENKISWNKSSYSNMAMTRIEDINSEVARFKSSKHKLWLTSVVFSLLLNFEKVLLYP